MRTRNQDKAVPADPSRRTSRKRRASSASDAPAPVVGTSSSSSQTTQVKRRKKLDDHPEELHLVEESYDETLTVSTPSQTRQVRFTEQASSQGHKDTTAHLTPHVRKALTNRRQTLSPVLAERRLAPNKKSRLSLPSSFDSPSSKKFRPLSQVLQERVKNRLRRNRLSEEIKEQRDANETHQELIQLRQEIGELEDTIRQRLHELDVQRQLGEDADDLRMEEIEADITSLRDDLTDKKEKEATLPDLDADDHIDIINDDMMIFDGSQDVSYPELPTDENVRTVKRVTDVVEVTNAQTQVALPDSSSVAERQAFEDAIKYWTRQASDAKATLEILTIELQSLGFSGPDSTSENILASIRDSFASIRERLESAVPGQIPTDITNSDFIDLVADHLESLADRVAQQEGSMAEGDQLREELVSEINGLIERLSQAEIRKRQLEIGFNELDEQSQKDEVLINGLEKQLKEIERNHDMAQTLITEKQAKLTNLDHENKSLESTIDKLGLALEGYRNSEDTLQQLVARMEKEHKALVNELEKSTKKTVNKLEKNLKEEATKRATAEADADDKQVAITDLERRVEMDETNIDSLKQQLAAMEEQKIAEQEAKEAAEGERDNKNSFVADLEVKIEQAETDLEDLRNELGRLRELKEAEQRQREAAEADLDELNTKIADLEKKLRSSGTQANELRQKIYELQLREKKAIQDLNDAAAEREEQFQTDMAAEVTRREESDATAAHRNVIIAELAEALRNLEDAMKLQLEERDEKITELAARNDQLQSELSETKEALNTALNALEMLQSSSESRIAQLTSDIVALQHNVAKHEATIKTLSAQAQSAASTHAMAITERDEKIADLNHDIFNAQSLIKTLESEKVSLERRVEAEAESMLELQSSKDDQIAALKDTIKTKQEEVEDLGRKAQEVDRSWERVMQQRDTEIAELQARGDNNAATIARLSKFNHNLKDKFRKYVRDSTATAQAMREEMETALLAASTKGGDLREEGRRVLEEVEAMDDVPELQKPSSSGSGLEKAHVKRFNNRRGRRQYDSGIGVDDETSMLLED